MRQENQAASQSSQPSNEDSSSVSRIARATNETASYDRVAKTLHWAAAPLVVALICLGFFMTTIKLPIGVRFDLYQLHKSLGFVLFAVMIARALWRLTHRPPPLPGALPAPERAAVHCVHLLLYVLSIALPIIGWLMVSAAAIAVPTRIFGWIPIPHLEMLAGLGGEERKSYEALFGMLHMWFAYGLAALVIGHVAAALRHHFLLKDDVLRRMLPGVRRRHGTVVLLACAGVCCIAAGKAAAQDTPTWTVDPARSSIAFSVVAGGEAVSGKFGEFSLAIAFDPQKPETAQITGRIRLASVATLSDDVDQMLADAAWFGNGGEAVYRTTKAEQTEAGKFRLLGELTLKGRTLPVAVPFSLTVENTHARGEGELMLDRAFFGVGPSSPVGGIVVDNMVSIRLVIVAERSP